MYTIFFPFLLLNTKLHFPLNGLRFLLHLQEDPVLLQCGRNSEAFLRALNILRRRVPELFEIHCISHALPALVAQLPSEGDIFYLLAFFLNYPSNIHVGTLHTFFCIFMYGE